MEKVPIDIFKDKLPEWKDLSEEEKAPYRGKVENMVDIMKHINPTKVTILTGSNGGGKSMIRQQYSMKFQKETGRKSKTISMQLRTSTNSEWGALSGAMLDGEWTPTSLNTIRLINGVFRATGVYDEPEPGKIKAIPETGYIILDEPEIGMAEETILALSEWLQTIIPTLEKLGIGLMIITHSKLLVENLWYMVPSGHEHGYYKHDKIDFVNLDNLTIMEYTDSNRRIVPSDLKLINANYMFNAIDERMDQVQKEKKRV